jgi:predicted dehydrogenase
MRIFQKDHYISLDFITGVSEVYRLQSVDEAALPNSISFGEIGVGDKKKRLIYEQPESKEINALNYELQLFVDSVLYDKKIVVSGEDGLRALKVAEIIIQKILQTKGS